MNRGNVMQSKCYCLFVRSGSEETVADALNQVDPNYKVIVPKRIMQEKTAGKWTEKSMAILPGYIFAYSESEKSEPFDNRVDKMYKTLRYDKEMRELAGDDLEYAMWVFRNHGQITPSKVLIRGDGVKIVDGPLKDCKGKVIRIDKHKRRAVVEFEFDGVTRTVSLSAEVITNYEEYRGSKSANKCQDIALFL